MIYGLASTHLFLKDLSDELSEKLVNFYLGWLEKHPHLHDKVEFDVIPTCVGPMFHKWESRLQQHADIELAEVDLLKKGLMGITQQAIHRTDSDTDVLQALEIYRQELKEKKRDRCCRKNTCIAR